MRRGDSAGACLRKASTSKKQFKPEFDLASRLIAIHRSLAGNVVITGANGDERGYNATTREGVSPDDMYFGQFHGFVFAPVTDDLLSDTLPPPCSSGTRKAYQPSSAAWRR